MAGFLWYAHRRKARERIDATIIAFNGARGDPKDIKKQAKDADRE